VTELEATLEGITPDATRYEIVDAEQIGKHLLVKANFPNCDKCSYEGTKILVYMDTSFKDALRWKKLDPHFREEIGGVTEAPSPDARFPASDDGWDQAQAFLRWLGQSEWGPQ